MIRTITGQAPGRKMTLGDLRRFIASLDGLPDEAVVKARVSWGKRLRSVTVEEDDTGFQEYLRTVGGDDDEVDKSPEEP